MALRHAVLATLLDRSASGCELTKTFDVTVANYWYASSQQLYAELVRLEAGGLVAGREVVQARRPNKRVFTITETGRELLQAFIDERSKPGSIRDDLIVKVQAAEAGDVHALIGDLTGHAEHARAKAHFIDARLKVLRGGLTEKDFLASSPRIGPYLTGLRGITLERHQEAWCRHVAQVLTARNRGGTDSNAVY